MQYHIIDVFTDKLFGGNPAGVCLLDKWLPDDVLQSIAAENNLSETAFLVKQNGYYDLRWFTPTIEVDLCGHATVASAFVLFEDAEKDTDEIKFKTMSGRYEQKNRINVLGGTHYSTEKFACMKICEYFIGYCLNAHFVEDMPVMEDL